MFEGEREKLEGEGGRRQERRVRHSLIQDKQAHTSVAGGTCACGAYCTARHHCHTQRERTLWSVWSVWSVAMCMIVQVTEHVTERDGNAEWQPATAPAGGAMSNEPNDTL